jgi:hypothetical protein
MRVPLYFADTFEWTTIEKLLGYIRKTRIYVNSDMGILRGGIILPAVRLYAVLRWLAGGATLMFLGVAAPGTTGDPP